MSKAPCHFYFVFCSSFSVTVLQMKYSSRIQYFLWGWCLLLRDRHKYDTGSQVICLGQARGSEGRVDVGECVRGQMGVGRKKNSELLKNVLQLQLFLLEILLL